MTAKDDAEIDEELIDPERQSKRSLAAALRSLVADVVDRDLDQSVAVDLLAGIEDLRARVVGSRRPRYYERGMGEPARVSFIDFERDLGTGSPFCDPDAHRGCGRSGRRSMHSCPSEDRARPRRTSSRSPRRRDGRDIRRASRPHATGSQDTGSHRELDRSV